MRYGMSLFYLLIIYGIYGLRYLAGITGKKIPIAAPIS